MSYNSDEIRKKVKKIQEIIQDMKLTTREVRGQCGIISDALAERLLQEEFSKIYYVCGEEKVENTTITPWSHAWLEVDGIIVDPTIHQFDGFNEPYVGIESEWHAKWEIGQKLLKV